MKKYILIALSIVCLAPSASALITLNAGAGPGLRNVKLSDGSPIPDGSKVSVGFFDSTFNVYENAGDPTALSGAFNEIGSTFSRSIFGQPGRFAGTFYSDDNKFAGKQAWIWVVSGNQFGLFTSDQLNWIIPSPDAPPLQDSTMINSSGVNSAAWGRVDRDSLFVSAVPEPTTWALIIFGAVFIGVAAFRRLRSRRIRRSRERVPRFVVNEYF